MGDHRASIKIEFTFHDKTHKADWWINYFPTEVEGVDQRIIEFFQNGYEEGMAKYRKDVWEADRENRDRRNKQKELEQLKRLKEKYEETP